MDRVRELCKAKGIPWIVDPKPSQSALYHGATCMTPNTKELSELSGMPAKGDLEVAAAGRSLVAGLGLEGLLVTRSEKGMALFAQDERHREPWLIPTEAREVFDVSGAGDTVIAVFSAAVSSGADWQAAAMLANAAAGVVVGKMGTATATPVEILRHYQDQEAM
jgi:D-beta-D-heptose 7-phosphate kinase/D-beta-D-heptose 1-phosphate adenosyltransferase